MFFIISLLHVFLLKFCIVVMYFFVEVMHIGINKI